MATANLGPLSFEVEDHWTPATVVMVAPRTETPALMSAKRVAPYRANLVVSFERTGGKEFDFLGREYRTVLEETMDNYELVGEEAIELNGRQALLREHSFVDADGFRIQQLELLCLIDSERLLHAIASDAFGEAFEGSRDKLASMLLGIRWAS